MVRDFQTPARGLAKTGNLDWVTGHLIVASAYEKDLRHVPGEKRCHGEKRCQEPIPNGVARLDVTRFDKKQRAKELR